MKKRLEESFFFFLSICLRGQGFITSCCFDYVQIDSSLSFSSDLVRGVHSRKRKRGRQPRPSLAFSHAHSNFQGVKITPLVGLI